ncbi:phospholipid/glycerol acyltransferase [Rhodopseudomonas palustris BisB5]|uniref:Phospholipid/glycerol acyltransferase n=1 Tax=Rhodopseudomonas palustris (strain BisB5) TaxID=316057 RepID=Q13CK5_RHOPS|nr:phospholipid/glycerol acyltransferase [Rhodopseudomonas palustris BisB5]
MTSIFVRSLIYNVLFYLLLTFWILVAVPTFVLPRRALMRVAKLWGQSSIWLMRVVCNTKVEFRGVEKIPPGPLIVAPKHQSMWETFALLQFFDAPVYILKRELTWIPFFGWLLMKADMIAINRQKRGRILMEMSRRAREEVHRGRQLIIFPEGTRTAVGAPPNYKAGVGQIYADCGAPCLPVALNSGLFWPRRQFMRYPGTLVVEFLDPLPAGLDRRTFIEQVSKLVETASNRLIEAGRKEQAELFGRVPSTNVQTAAPKVADRDLGHR